MKEDKESKYEVVQVPNTYELKIQTPTEELLSIEQALVDILNKLDRLIGKI